MKELRGTDDDTLRRYGSAGLPYPTSLGPDLSISRASRLRRGTEYLDGCRFGKVPQVLFRLGSVPTVPFHSVLYA